jgi:hypothetical protein
MAKIITAQPKFKMLVANISNAGDPSRGLNPVKDRQGFVMQLFPEVPRGSDRTKVLNPSAPGITTYQGLGLYTTPPEPVAATGDVTVADNNFTAPAVLYIGPYVVVSGDDYTPGGSTALTATALAAAIDALPGYSAIAVGSVVTVTGLTGPNGNVARFEATYRGTVQNFTLSPTGGSLTGGEPRIGPPELL